MTPSTIPGNASTPAYFLGVDGGGSKTLAIVVDADGVERGRGLAESSNYHTVGVQQAAAQICRAAEQAAAAANCHLPLAAAWLGLAGVDRPDDVTSLQPHLRPLAETVRLTNDAELVLGGLEQGVGVALIVGTGSIALGRNAQGASARAGGWGHLLGDEGSGYDIGQQALRAAMRAADGRGAHTILLENILTEWKLATASDIITPVYRAQDKAQIARLAPLVLAAARAGDSVASRIARRAAVELALAASSVSDALGFHDEIPLALSGGLLIHEEDFRAEVLRRIRRYRPIVYTIVVTEPALSAARAVASAVENVSSGG